MQCEIPTPYYKRANKMYGKYFIFIKWKTNKTRSIVFLNIVQVFFKVLSNYKTKTKILEIILCKSL